MGDSTLLGELGEPVTWRGKTELGLDTPMARLFAGQPNIHKFAHYIPAYEQHFGPHRHEAMNMLEIGVANGGSLQLWRNYFPKARIVGVDINPKCMRYDDPDRNVHVRIGAQQDADFLCDVVAELGPFTIVLDDGSHLPADQLESFRWLFVHGLADGGVYLVEDLSHCYFDWSQDGTPTFTKVIAELVDVIHAPYVAGQTVQAFETQLDELTAPLAATLVGSITIHDGIVAITREPRTVPWCVYRPPKAKTRG